jgi:hypothetical protein
MKKRPTRGRKRKRPTRPSAQQTRREEVLDALAGRRSAAERRALVVQAIGELVIAAASSLFVRKTVSAMLGGEDPLDSSHGSKPEAASQPTAPRKAGRKKT